MYSNIIISGTGISYPENNVCTRDAIESHFAKKGIRVQSLMNILGKDKRYSIDETMDYYDMIENAVNKALDEAKVKADEIDLIIFATDTPEYLAPTNALKLAKIIDAKNVQIAYDMNANCAGGVMAIDQGYRYLKTDDRYNKALICTTFMASFERGEEEVVSSIFSDSAAAVVLEKREEEIKRGIIDSFSKIDYRYDKMDEFPKIGFREVLMNNKRTQDDMILNISHEVDLSFIPDIWKICILNLLKRNNLEANQIKKYLFSQFSLLHIKITIAKLLLNSDKYVYIGGKYGYNGCCSPIFALDSVLKENLIQCNDYIVFCGIGSGYECYSILYKF